MKGCLGLYLGWAALVGIFVALLRGTDDRDEAAAFGVLLLVLPGAVAAGLWWGERLLRQASERLGFPVRKLSKKDGHRFEPSFEAEESDREWFVTLLEGERDGMGVAVYDRVGRDQARSRSAPRTTLPPVAPGSASEGFGKRFSTFGEPGAEVLLTAAVQAALLGLPPRCRLVLEGARLRWEVEREAPLSRGLGRRAEELLRITVPLRDALLEAAALLPARRPQT